MTPELKAKKSAESLWKDDRATKWMGAKLVEVTPGSAILSLNVQEHHTNGHNICHGGVIFMLADSAFAFACNSYNQRRVGQHSQISYLRPAKLQDTLFACAKKVEHINRSAIYDVKVHNEEERTIAEFRGFAREIKGTLFEEEPTTSKMQTEK